MRILLDCAVVYLAALGFVTALLTAFTVRDIFRVVPIALQDEALFGVAALGAGLVTLIVTGAAPETALLVGIGFFAGLGVRRMMPQLTPVGALAVAQLPLGLLAGAPFVYLLLADHDAPGWLLGLVLAAVAVAAVLAAMATLESIARQAVMTHAAWRRPRLPLTPRTGTQAPKVSIHLPAYAEPPEIVIAVLDRLAALDYPDFEVLVCDNNTQDEALWRPVEAHCARLNRRGGIARFRFFHVAPLAGAKAGALNWLLDRTAPDAALIAVIDADYLARADFLSRLVGFFDDPRIAYVQTPHDYRGHEGNAYLNACYWEYMPANKLEMPGINEYGAAFTIGTMCVLRRDALEQAGRWAEWCLTEDSEVSVRLRQNGHGGIYLPETFGRGLIPENFSDYKKQRFRWTAGPVQQLVRHWRLYLPQALGGSRTMHPWSKLLEVQRALAPLLQLTGMVLGYVGSLIAILVVAAGIMPPLEMPQAVWAAMLLAGATMVVTTAHRLRLAGCRSVGAGAMGEFARLSLSYVQMMGGVAGLSPKPLAWRRTPKFRPQRSATRALHSTLPETIIGGIALLPMLLAWMLADRVGGDFVTLATIGSLALAFRFLAAPVMALLGERQLAAAPDAVRDGGMDAAAA